MPATVVVVLTIAFVATWFMGWHSVFLETGVLHATTGVATSAGNFP